ncbi:PIN domain-containing protein [Algoriphagus sp. H41]|uniref:PIN domain-containing protein n=1 Tax=Algoriphagus oliviformis TaxID=2811231 RepID=A0ABS3BZA2_9BACT|nr:PIN domain-containing protein [Algoriphagus oliviformis]MBN7810187.1 PIN domain-containing protein [Algoriphagus oliviformis]
MTSSYFIDSDIILDAILERELFVENATKIFELATKRQITLFCSSIIITNVFYIVRKSKGLADAFSIIQALLETCNVLSVGKQEIKSAISSKFTDFEDAIQYYTALTKPDISGIITRNTSDFKQSTLPVYSPDTFLALLR